MRAILRRSIAFASGALLTIPFAFVAPAYAQDDTELEEVITTGTRARERSVTESPAPIDVISGEDFVNQADTDLVNLFRNIVPSYNANTQPISDAATIVRPATLRGLAPDHTLVLVNGKRRHRAAVIYWLGNGIADGAQGPDISAIPSIALKQVEVLRDGAASQYGSDAIAGVINFKLKDAPDGSSIEAKYSETGEGDGQTFVVAGNVGLPFSDDGFVNLSFEYGSADATDRSVQRSDAADLITAGNTNVLNPAQIWGQPEVDDDFKFFANVGLDLGDDKEFYAHGNYAGKHVDGGFFFRNPNTRGAVFSDDGGATLLIGDAVDAQDGIVDGSAGCPTVTITSDVPDPIALAEVFARDDCFSFQELFPGGFTPRFGGDVTDLAMTAGVRGEMDNGVYWDFSGSTAMNDVDFFIRNTVNASLGPATPTFFNPGDYTQFETALNADFAFQPSDNSNIAFGAEYRKETFEITTGQEESFQIGPYADQGFSAASNGFPGFSNIAGGKFGRENVGLYVDGELEVNEDLLLGAAIRWEDFQDFGTTTNTKLGFNWRVMENFGVRGTWSTGFKAPTPGQSNAFNVSTEFDFTIMDLVNNGTIPSTSAVAELRGGKQLQPEESTNYTIGFFFDLFGADVTLDYYNIEMEDRLNLSGLFSLTAAEINQLIAEGVTSAGNLQNFRFFTNDFETETQGLDIVVTYPMEWDNGGQTDFSLAWNHNNTRVTRAGPTIMGDPTRILELEAGLPPNRGSLTANHFFAGGDWRVLGRASYWTEWYDSEDAFFYDDTTVIFDTEVAYDVNENVSLFLGAQNLFDEFPPENPGATGIGNQYSQFTPFGFNGRVWYVRAKFAQ